ncbi:hypothetical protein M3Y97_01082300 [Aphelenchoides bicaudatus]|nr:hypothetical protein M3Y97_01082300 [Aphelenchoides bicaudatus]
MDQYEEAYQVLQKARDLTAKTNEHMKELEMMVDEFISGKEDILAFTKNFHSDVLIRSANLDDFISDQPFMRFCAHALAERAQGKTLEDARQMFHIADDQFTDEKH